MGRAPCCDKSNVKKGPWSPEEDAKLKEFIERFGTGGNWIALPQKAGLRRCGKSCRLRWLNYLRPNIRHGEFSDEEDRIICTLYASIGSRWSIIAAQLPGRTDNDIKNYWNTKLKKKLMIAGINSNNKISPPQPPFSSLSSTLITQSPHHQPAALPITLSQLYNSFYNQASKSLMINNNNNNIDYQPMFSTTQNVLNSNSFSSFTSPQYTPSQNLPEGFVDLQYNNYQPLMKLADSNMLMFGNNEAAATSCCSNSSDGSCSQISYGVKQEEIRGPSSSSSSFQGFTATTMNPTNDRHDNRFVLQNYGDHHQQQQHQQQFMSEYIDHDHHHKTNGVLENNELQHELEHVKQLIISGDMSKNMINNNKLSLDDNDDDDDKYKTTHERGVYQYQYYYLE